jgi:hypothetical protein
LAWLCLVLGWSSLTIIFMKVFLFYFLLRWSKPMSFPYQTYFVFFMWYHQILIYYNMT